VFVWVDFKYQQCFSEIAYCTLKYSVNEEDKEQEHGSTSRRRPSISSEAQ